MIIHNVQQGSDIWAELRASHFCASEAAAMLGLSDKVSRNELLRMKATGDQKEFSDWVQKNVLDHGHEVEERARPHAQRFIGAELYPITASIEVGGLKLLASYDGLTEDLDKGFEHKQIQQALRAYVLENDDAPDTHWPQLEHQLLIMGDNPDNAILFTVSDGSAENATRIWYRSKPERRAKIIAGWQQFAEDLANYQHVEVIPAAVAAAQPTLPAVSVQVTGQIAVRDNLTIFGDALKAYIERINKQPETDQDFADLDATVKKLKEVEECLSASEASAIAQTGDVDLLCRTINDLRELARANRLTVEKLVKAEKENRKNAIIEAGKKALAAHIQSLTDSLKRVQMPNVPADFNGCAKNLRTIDSLKNAVDTCLANAKIEANQIAEGIRFNLTTYDEIGADYPQLFPDLAQIVTKAKDDFTSTIKLRIAEHKEAERARAEKAEREAAAAREAEQRRLAEAEAQRQQQAGEVAAKVIEDARKPDSVTPPASIPAEPVERGNVTKISAAKLASSGLTDDDLRQMIGQHVASMNRAQLNQTLEFCKQKLAA